MVKTLPNSATDLLNKDCSCFYLILSVFVQEPFGIKFQGIGEVLLVVVDVPHGVGHLYALRRVPPD